MKRNKGITLIALVITIIILLILAGISIMTLTGENGLLTRAKQATGQYEEASAKEKLELVMAELGMDKITDAEYNENSYIDKKIREQGMLIIGNIVIVDEHQFSIDRSVPKIGEYLGKWSKDEMIEIELSYKLGAGNETAKTLMSMAIT